MAVFKDTLRILTFRFTGEDVQSLGRMHLALGLTATWLVGMGRYWDNPRAELLQHLGVGSLIYVFALSLVLWLVVLPLRPPHWQYFKVLTFVTLTAPPAMLYAIPVERFTSLDTAISLNVWFLAIVAAWRVALLILLYRRYAQLDVGEIAVATLLPLTLIVGSLAVLNLEHVVVNIMAGLRPEERSQNDGVYDMVTALGALSTLTFIPVLLGYLTIISARRHARRVSAGEETDGV